MRITVLGMGGMGRAFAGRAIDRGHGVTVWNRSPGRADDLVVAGATEIATVHEAVARADVVLVVVADDDAVRAVCLGDDGALASMHDDGTLVCVSTVAPETVIALGAHTDRPVLDAPVLGAPQAVRRGEGRFLVGGDRAGVDALDPLWEDLGSGATYCGPLGCGETVKLICNMLLITGVAAMAEGIAMGRGHGLSDDLLREVLAHSPVISAASATRLDTVLDRSHPGWFTPALAAKDIRLATEVAEQAGVEGRMGPAAGELLSAVIDDGTEWDDFSAVIEAFD